MILAQHTINTPYMVGPVHCYSLDVAGDLVLFDTGPPTMKAKAYLSEHLDLSRLKYVVVTHCHVDHCGLLRWLEKETPATCYLPFHDHQKVVRQAEHQQLMAELLRQVGFDAAFLERFRQRITDGTIFPQLPDEYQIIEEGLPDELGIAAVACPGHSQSDLVLTGDCWAVTGDVLLEDIFQTPMLDIDLESGHRFNNYWAYCNSLETLNGLAGKVILPGHHETVADIAGCLLFYVNKLLERAMRMKQVPAALPAAQVIRSFPNYSEDDPIINYLKVSEIVFLRDFLADPQRLRAALVKIDLFSPVEELFSRVAG